MAKYCRQCKKVIDIANDYIVFDWELKKIYWMCKNCYEGGK